MLRDRFSRIRLGSFGIIFLSTLILSVVIVLRSRVGMDRAFCMFFVDLVFMLLLFFALEYERVHGFLAENTESSFRRIAVGYGVGSLLTAVFAVVPDFYKPVIVLAVLMSALSNYRIAMTSALYWCVLLGIANTGNSLELVSNLLLVVLGCSLCVTLQESKYRLYVSFLFFCLTLLVPSIFYYWTYGRITYTIYIYGTVAGIIAAIAVFLCYDMVFEETEYEVRRSYRHLVQPDYVRARELRRYSETEYTHARTVANLSRVCAEEIGIDSELCEVAGFYYRMGKWVGEPHVENGVKRAAQLCFPKQVQQILAEYNGEKQAISSKESAVIHMVDILVLKGEVMEEQMDDSRWNREMLVNQTLNGLSEEGLYDESGLSINEFLRLRDFLTKAIHGATDESEEQTEEEF